MSVGSYVCNQVFSHSAHWSEQLSIVQVLLHVTLRIASWQHRNGMYGITLLAELQHFLFQATKFEQ